MAKRPRETTHLKIKKWIKEGRGSGTGADYKPWLQVQDVPSIGLAHRLPGIFKANRIYHLFSNLELYYFAILEWSEVVYDIREQFPLLDLEETLKIARELGVRHPADPKTQEPIVLTTDFRITCRNGLETTEYARTVKPVNKLQSIRQLEKYEIERRYWASRNISWGVVTDNDIPKPFAKNVLHVRDYYEISDRVSLTPSEIDDVSRILAQDLAMGSPLRSAAASCDKRLGLDRGSSLTVAYHLIARRKWIIDMNVPIEPGKNLALLNRNSQLQLKGS